MADETGFWGRMSEEFRSVSDRTRASARRAVSIGVLRVDLVSLRRDRSRALSDLGARALALWNGGTPHALHGPRGRGDLGNDRAPYGAADRAAATRRQCRWSGVHHRLTAPAVHQYHVLARGASAIPVATGSTGRHGALLWVFHHTLDSTTARHRVRSRQLAVQQQNITAEDAEDAEENLKQYCCSPLCPLRPLW